MRLLFIMLGLQFLCPFQAYTQTYDVKLSPVEVENLGGLQSYAVGTHDGEWLLVGGRLDGLHRRQPFAAFSADGKNQDLIVVNPTTNSVWRRPLSDLPTKVREQLSSSNMQFYQDGERLICTGGYGYSPTAGDHITFPYLTVIDLPSKARCITCHSGPGLSAVEFHVLGVKDMYQNPSYDTDPSDFRNLGRALHTQSSTPCVRDICQMVGHTFEGHPCSCPI